MQVATDVPFLLYYVHTLLYYLEGRLIDLFVLSFSLVRHLEGRLIDLFVLSFSLVRHARRGLFQRS